MQITIDSRERLDDVLRVVGTLYGVTLTQTGVTTSEHNRGSADVRSGRGQSTRKATRTRETTRQSAEQPASAGAVRQWATAQGMAVSGRGALPRTVRDAYAAAHA